MVVTRLLVGLVLLGTVTAARARAQSIQPDLAHVDGAGVMRWTANGEEVSLFGVNYSTPFAYAYRAHASLGISHEAAIDADVAHMARLGFDAFRVHVWDREVSDRAGNLLENDHLRLLDYLIAKLSERGIFTLLTPIAWWGTGWPEPDPPTEGFSSFFTKAEMITNAEARAAQRNYVRQFLEHVNAYTGLAYKDDPRVIAIELFNEPAHREPPEETTRFIDELVEVVRSTGFTRPIFYNVSQNWSDAHARAVAAADVQGVSFQWYPTGLVRDATVRGNFLPNAARYPIPGDDVPGFDRLARMVYEFDAADVAGSYIYPAMARSFREAGMQWATQFSYDPLHIGWANTEYGTHYVNLLYTPGKALSLMIAGEAFRRLPRGRPAGRPPESGRSDARRGSTDGGPPAGEQFGAFRVSYDEDLSEMITRDAFYHSNDTRSAPPSPEHLQRIAGVGSSPLVRYDGTGAYFLDKLMYGAWRLEVYPDAVWLVDPFGRTSLSQEVSRLIWRTRSMGLNLPDLGANFSIRPLSEGRAHERRANEGAFDVAPGVFLLTRDGTLESDEELPERAGKVGMREFIVPEPRQAVPAVRHDPPGRAVAGDTLRIEALVASERPPRRVILYARRPGWRGFLSREMVETASYRYAASLAGDALTEGPLEYFISVEADEQGWTFPGALSQRPDQWDFAGVGSGWQALVADPAAPIVLFRALTDAWDVTYPHQEQGTRYSAGIVGGSTSADAALQVRTDGLGRPPYHLAVGLYCGDAVAAAGESLAGRARLQVRARALEPSTNAIMLTLVQSDGSARSARIPLEAGWATVEVPLSEFRPARAVLLPRAYPFFLPYWSEERPAQALDLRRLESIQIGLDATEADAEKDAAHGFELQEISLR